MSGNDCKIYVGNLPSDIRKRDLEDIFYKYGKVVDVDLHERRESPFAFVEFEDPRDAEDAVRGRDGYTFDGYKIRVEFPRSSSRGGRGGNRGNNGGGNYGGRRPSGGRGNRPKGHQLMISGLPSTGSWQDIKDHFRQAGDVVYADVQREGSGVVEFARYEHAKRALRDLDDSKFRSHEGETAYIRVTEASSSSPPYNRRSRSDSRSPRRSSPKQYDSPRRSPHRSPHRSPSPRYNDTRRSRSRSN